MRRILVNSFAAVAALLALTVATSVAAAPDTTGMGDWARPTIEGLVKRTDYTERHVLYGEPNGTRWAALSFDKHGHGSHSSGRVALAEVLRNPSAAHRWELIKITSLNDTDAFFTVGYAEALATHVSMYNNWFNDPKSVQPHPGSSRMQSVDVLVAALRHYPQDTPYGLMVRRLMRQIDGLWAGWEAAYKASGSPADMADFSWLSVFILSYHEDLENYPPINTTAAPQQQQQHPLAEGNLMDRPTHCVSVHRLRPDGELLIGHASEDTYTCMLRQLKTYVFLGGLNITMTGYPGMLYSADDFIVTARGLLIASAAVKGVNVTNRALFNPRGVPGMFGTMIASYLAETPTQWAELYATDDAGTYSSQFMITDMLAFRAAQRANTTVPNGSFIVLEAVPTSVHYEDMTPKLLADQMWLAFDVAYFNVTRHLLAINNTIAFGLSDYETSALAVPLRRDMPFVVNETTMFYAMRHNNWPNDPTQLMPWCKVMTCPPEMSRAPIISASPRADLLPFVIKLMNHTLKPSPEGGVDAKVTSTRMLLDDPSHPMFILQNGPTFVQQRPFSFDGFYDKFPAERAPLRGLPLGPWDFPPALMSPNATVSLADSDEHAGGGIAGGIVVALVVVLLLIVVVVGFVALRAKKQRKAFQSEEPHGPGESTKLV